MFMFTLLPEQIVMVAGLFTVMTGLLLVVSVAVPEVSELAVHPDAKTFTSYLLPFMAAPTPVRVSALVVLPL